MNEAIFYFFYNFAHQSAFFDDLVVFLAVYFPYVVVFLAGVFIIMHHEIFKAESTFQVFIEKKKEILRAFLTGTVAYLLGYGLKILIEAPRPIIALAYKQDLSLQVIPLFNEHGYAFPSGHVTFFFALTTSIFFFHKKAGYWFMACAIIIGIARVIAGVHFPIDILGGCVLGFLVAYFLKNV